MSRTIHTRSTKQFVEMEGKDIIVRSVHTSTARVIIEDDEKRVRFFELQQQEASLYNQIDDIQAQTNPLNAELQVIKEELYKLTPDDLDDDQF